MTFAWNEATFERAKALYAAGQHSAAQIAAVIGTTKGAVIGKMGRAGVSSPRTKADNAPPRPRAERKPVERKGPAKLPPPQPVMLAPSPATGKTLMDLAPRECRFPTGENAEGKHVFCAAETLPNASYCPDCRALVYAPPGTKQRVGYVPMRGIG